MGCTSSNILKHDIRNSTIKHGHGDSNIVDDPPKTDDHYITISDKDHHALVRDISIVDGPPKSDDHYIPISDENDHGGRSIPMLNQADHDLGEVYKYCMLGKALDLGNGLELPQLDLKSLDHFDDIFIDVANFKFKSRQNENVAD